MGRRPSGGGRQHTTLSKFPKNCMKSRNFWAVGGEPPLDPPLHWKFKNNEFTSMCPVWTLKIGFGSFESVYLMLRIQAPFLCTICMYIRIRPGSVFAFKNWLPVYCRIAALYNVQHELMIKSLALKSVFICFYSIYFEHDDILKYGHLIIYIQEDIWSWYLNR